MFQPPPRMTVREWADAFRYLSPEASAEPGKYSSERAPYQREPMEALSDPLVETTILMWPSQVGKTEIANNFIGRQIDHRPGPMLVMQPTLDMAETWSKDRFAPMIRDTPVLAKKVRDAKSRASDNTILHKKFPAGHLTGSVRTRRRRSPRGRSATSSATRSIAIPCPPAPRAIRSGSCSAGNRRSPIGSACSSRRRPSKVSRASRRSTRRAISGSGSSRVRTATKSSSSSGAAATSRTD
jgi:hypothetical protein